VIVIDEAIIVEGKYDKIKLSSIVDAVIIETNGFAIFKDREKMELIRKLADKSGIIVLTDSDSAGFMIRSKLSSSIAPDRIKQAFVPDIFGKEKRKDSASKEGKIGVEGMDSEIILQALRQAGAVVKSDESKQEITKADFFNWGLTGGADSTQKRKKLLKKLELPERLSTKMMISVVNRLYDRKNFFKNFIETLK